MIRTTDKDPLGSGSGRVYILPTRYGYIFIAVLSAMLVGSINYNNNLGFLLTFLLGSLALVSALHAFRNISGIRVGNVQARPVFAGEYTGFTCQIHAIRFPGAAVRLSFGDGHAQTAHVAAGTGTRVRIQVKTSQRGVLTPGPLRIESQYPLGLFRAWMRFSTDARCLVYPRPMNGPVETVNGTSAGDTPGKPSGMGVDDFQELRPYQPGDSLQHISWKVFSRGQGLFTKQFQGQSGASDILDWAAVTEPDVEKKLSRLCHMVLASHRDRLSYSLKLPGRTIAAGTGQAHRQDCLTALALFGFSAAGASR